MPSLKYPIGALLVLLLFFSMKAELNDMRELGTQNAHYTGELAEVSRLEREMLIFINKANSFVTGSEPVEKSDVLLAFDLLWARVNTTQEKHFYANVETLRAYQSSISQLSSTLVSIDAVVQGLKPGDTRALAAVNSALRSSAPEISAFTTTAFSELQNYSLHQTQLQRSAMQGLFKVQLGFLAVTAGFVIFLLYQLERGNRLLATVRKRESEISRLASTDHMTGLSNRRDFEDRLAAAIAGKSGPAHHLLLVDLDGFKAANDTHGHGVGDDVLREAAQRLKRLAGPSDSLARFGGDEFAMLIAGDREEAARRAAQIVTAIALPFNIADNDISIGASVGIAGKPAGDAGSGQMIHNADMALYRAKRNGRNQFSYFSEDFAALAAHLERQRMQSPTQHKRRSRPQRERTTQTG